MTTLITLILVILLIIIVTTRFNIHPFLSLLTAAIIMGFAAGFDGTFIITKIADGFGNTLKSIGIIIAFGTIIGAYLEQSGGASAMAAAVLKVIGEKKSPLAMNITGFIVSIPVFCDSGFVILSTLNKALSKKTKTSIVVLTIALAAGLYTTHVFVPPTPGPLAAAATLNADIGLVLIFGLIVAIPTALAGLAWALIYGRNKEIAGHVEEEKKEIRKLPGTGISFAPIIIPIILIALKSVADYPSHPFGEGFLQGVITFLGNPVIALLIGVITAFKLKPADSDKTHFDWVTKGLKDAGIIILITGAGGAFGNVLRATDVGATIGEFMSQWSVGIFLPFLIAAILKSAQGSSTVAIITTAAIISPLLVSLGLDTPVAKALVVLAIGAGAMTVSHVNDSYFWVVSQFSGMDTATALRGLTVATLFQGIVGIITISILATILV
ncbi:MAG: GntP family permease [Ignavibacteria bacterium]|jgi:GntP family gluconate:H+ symporter